MKLNAFGDQKPFREKVSGLPKAFIMFKLIEALGGPAPLHGNLLRAEQLNKHGINKLLLEVFGPPFFKKVGRRRHYKSGDTGLCASIFSCTNRASELA